jgi:prevent-host-death family protein
MRFISVREFRSKSGDVWKELAKEQEIVITSNGKPIAMVLAVTEETLEDLLRNVRRARDGRGGSDAAPIRQERTGVGRH